MLTEGLAGLLLLLTGAIAFEEIHYSKDGYCPQLSHISVGRVKPDSLVNSRTAVVGAVAHYTCAHGYEIEGNPNRTCVSSVHGLHWTPSEKPRCTPRRCPSVTNFNNGYVFEGTRFPGSTNVFSCYPSHVLVGARFLRCQQNWTWDGTAPSCVRACPLTPPLANGRYNQTFAPIGQSVEVICDRCHNATNGRFLRCGDDGEFEQPNSVCDPMLCPTPFGQALPSAVIVEYMCDSIAKFDCPTGQRLEGVNNVTCQENGTWSADFPSCVSLSPAQQIGNNVIAVPGPLLIGGCVLPDIVPNGDFVMKLPGQRLGETFIVDGNDKEKQYDLDVLLGHLAPGQERIVPEGTITQYMCNHGYHLEGNRRTVCVAEEWKGDLPECIAITCSPPDEDAAGFGYYVMEGNRVGDTASFRCYNGYYSNRLPHMITCSGEGNWTGGEHPSCEKVSCGFPPAYDDVELVGGDFQGDVTLRCHDSAANVTTDLEISCQANGRWNLDSGFSCSLAVVGTLLNQNNAYVRVDITEVLFPSTVQPGIHTIRQFIIPTSMRCCKRLIPGETYLFTGRFFGQMLFTSGCRDIFYHRYNNQNQLLYSHSSATFAKFHPFCPSKL